jgi:16S rRNA (cytosine1402-N4)-methyltransferase
MLRPGGRLAVISFHSLEDRIVKHYVREQAKGCTCPPDFPICACGREPVLRDLTRRPIRPGSRELERNPRSASAKLRVAVKA